MNLQSRSGTVFLIRMAGLAVVVTVALVSAARAAIVYTDVGGLGVGGPPSIFLDMGESGFGGSANNTNTYFAEADFRIYMFASNNYRPWIDGQNGGLVNSDSGWAKKFDFGDPISGADATDRNLNDPSGNNPNWAYGTRGYLGVQFNAGTYGQVNGWIDVMYGPYLTLYGFAYDTSGGPIAAGAGSVSIPEPSMAPALAGLCAAGFAICVRRRQRVLLAPLCCVSLSSLA